MKLQTVVCAVAACSLLAYGVAAQQPPTPTDPPPLGTPSAPTAPASPLGACTVVGPVLGPSDFGVAAGLPVADVSAVRLADGRVRLYMFAQGLGVVSAISLGPDGTTFVAEPGARLPDGSGMPRAVVLPDTRIRLFYTTGDGIASAISADGLNFAGEPGFRITATQAAFSGTTVRATSGATVVALADGRYRMYFSDLPRPGDPPGGHLVKSALSTDQLTWTLEPGVRLGPGALTLSESAEHPFALSNPNGSVTLYYGKFGNTGSANAEGVYQSTSTDGLTFTAETLSVGFGNDPDAVRLVDGTLMLYYGRFDPAVGGTINAARCPDPGAAAAAPGGSATPLTVTIVGTVGSTAFTPNPLTTATVGSSIVFTNADVTTHRLVLDDAMSTEIGVLAPGQSSVPMALTTSGATYHCSIHPSMVGSLGTTTSATAPPAAAAPPADYGTPGGYYDYYRLRPPAR